MIINHNITAQNTYNRLSANNNAQSKSIEKLSSGLRINRAGDDAAGLAISEKMRGQIRGLDQAQRNSQDGISMIQTAEGALNETHSILQRMRELAVQAGNDSNTSSDRKEIQKEVNQLTDEIDRIANTTEFNTQKLLDGSKVGLVDHADSTADLQNNSAAKIQLASTGQPTTAGESFTVQITRSVGTAGATYAGTDYTLSTVGGTHTATLTNATTITYNGQNYLLDTTSTGAQDLTNLKSGESLTLSVKAEVLQQTDVTKAVNLQIGANSGQNLMIGINSMKARDLGLRMGSSTTALDVSTDAGHATAAVTQISNAIETVSAERSKLGAVQNRLEHTINNLSASSENISSAESRVRDVDMAKEMMNQQKNSILSQAATAMLAQANQLPSGVLQLLK